MLRELAYLIWFSVCFCWIITLMSSENSHIEKPGDSEAAVENENAIENASAIENESAVSMEAVGDAVVPSETSPSNVSASSAAGAGSLAGEGKTVYRIDQPEVPMDEEALLKLLDDNSASTAPTETYTHPVTGREVYVPKNSKALGPSAIMMTASLLMFVGGSLATSLMVARAFDFHGQLLLIFVISSSAFVLSLAGGLLVRTLGDGKNWFVGAGVGACFGAMGAVIVYLQTQHHPWWQ